MTSKSAGRQRTASDPFTAYAALLLFLTVLLSYGGSLKNGFVSDDRYLILERLPEYTQSFPLARAFTESFWKGQAFDRPRAAEESKDYYRPLVTISYALDAVIWKQHAIGYHLTNLILHLAASVLVLLLLRQLGVEPILALPAALLFAAHPIHAASVAWISGRTDLLAGVFVLAGLLCFFRHLDRRAAGVSPWKDRWLWIGLLCYLLGLLSKEMALTFGGLLLLGALVRGGQPAVEHRGEAALARGGEAATSERSWKQRIPWIELSCVAGLTLIFMFVRAAALGLPDFQAGTRTVIAPFRLALFPMAYGYYWKALIFPGTLHFFVPLKLPTAPTDPRFLLALLALLVQVVGTCVLLRKNPVAGFGAAWILISLLPVSHLVPLAFRAVVAEYWAYLPSVGYVVLVAGLAGAAARTSFAQRLASKLGPKRLAAAVLLLFALFGCGRLPARAAVFRSELGFLLYTVQHNPEHLESWVTLGAEYGERGDLEKSYQCLRTAIRGDPKTRGAWGNLANVYHARGEADSALIAYRKELALYPDASDIKINMADVLIERGQESGAASLYREVIGADPENAQLIFQRAQLVSQSVLDRRRPAAREQQEKDLRLAAGMVRAWLDASGRNDAEQLRNLAWMELLLGRFDRADSTARRAVAADPTSNRGRTLALLAELERAPAEKLSEAATYWRESPTESAEAERLGDSFEKAGRIELALPVWRSLLRAGRTEPDRLNHVAAGMLKDSSRPGTTAGARSIWEMLIEEVPDYPYSLLNLGAIASSAGEYQRCRSYWQRFLALYPERAEAAELKDRLAQLPAGRSR